MKKNESKGKTTSRVSRLEQNVKKGFPHRLALSYASNEPGWMDTMSGIVEQAKSTLATGAATIKGAVPNIMARSRGEAPRKMAQAGGEIPRKQAQAVGEVGYQLAERRGKR